MSDNNGSPFLAFVAGAAIGAIAGILYAPEKGSVTRENLKTGFDDLKNNLQNAKQDFTGQLTNTSFNLEETYENFISNLSHKTEDVITYLENKLAELKQKNAQYQKNTNYSE